MIRVLVIGAGGVFGGWLARGLARDGFEVVVAGRDAARTESTAQSLRERYPDAVIQTAVLDVRSLTPQQLSATGASIVADAAGPFQGAEPKTARAAIAAGLHYVDLADGRDFVAAFPVLDDMTRAAGVTALTGCSSTPALSNTVLDRLTVGWREVASVEVSISPGARAPRGLSVMQAILSWMGRPVRVFEGGGWHVRQGWSGLVRRGFGAAGSRWLSLCETPDLDILPARHRPTTGARMLAGLEPPLLHFGAWALARLGGMLSFDLTPAAWWLLPLSRLFNRLGSDRGAMRVEALGIDGEGRAVRAVWRLIADAGAGPVTPCLPALAAVKAIAVGGTEAGARACVGELSLEMLEAEIARHAIRTETVVERAALFHQAIGAPFDVLPAPIRALHETPGQSLWRGEARTWGAETQLGQFIARWVGFPGALDAAPAEVRIDADGRRSVWRRTIGGSAFSSVLSRTRAGGRVRERFGPFSFELRLESQGERLVYRVEGWRIGPVPLPRFLAPGTRTHEEVDAEGRFVFDVEISAPLVGRLVRYRGWLERAV